MKEYFKMKIREVEKIIKNNKKQHRKLIEYN